MQYKLTAEISVMSFMQDGYLVTAHQLAKMTGYSPQHINRVFKKLFCQGKVAYTIVSHQGKSGFARKWCLLGKTREHHTYAFVTPDWTQLEMTL